MAEFRVEFTSTNEQVEKLNRNGFKLCVAIGMEGIVTFNVLAFSSPAAPRVTVSWRDEFLIAPTSDEFRNGARISTNTRPVPIRGGSSYTIPEFEGEGILSGDDSVRSDSFRMINHSLRRASVVVFNVINGQPQPIYLGNPLEPRDSQAYAPSYTVALWIEENVETATMLAVERRRFDTFDLRSRSSITVHWDGEHFVEGEARDK